MKPVSLTKSSLFEQMVREEYTRAKLKNIIETHKQEMLQEKLIAEKGKLLTDPNWDMNWIAQHGPLGEHPWPGPKKAAQQLLVKMGAKPIYGSTYDGMRFISYDDTGAKNDILTFYAQDNEAYSSNLGSNNLIWKQAGSEFKLYDDKWKLIGTIAANNGKAIFKYDPAYLAVTKAEVEKKKDAATYTTGEKVIDRIQTILDWAGLVPVIGDALDVINAVIYGIRGKWLDAFFSAIAIIPVVGTALSLTVKSAFKSLKLAKKGIKVAESADEIRDAWKLLLDNKILKKDEIAMVNKGFKVLMTKGLKVKSWILKSGKDYMTKEVSDALLDGIDKFDEVLNGVINVNTAAGKYTSNVAGDLAKKSKNLADVGTSRLTNLFFTKGNATAIGSEVVDVTGKIADATAQRLSWMSRASSKLKGPIRKILASSKVTKEVGQTIARGLQEKFIKEFANDPTKLVVLLKTSMNNPKLVNELAQTYAEKFGKIGSAAYERKLKKATSALTSRNSRGLRDMFTNMANGTDAINKDWFKLASEKIVSDAVDPSSPNMLYSAFIGDQMNVFKQYIQRDLVGGMDIGSFFNKWLGNLSGAQGNTFVKKLDIISSEIQDAISIPGNAIGATEDDTHHGFIMYGIADWLVNTFPAVFGKTGFVNKAFNSPALDIPKAAAKTIATKTGIINPTYTPQDVK